MLEKEVKVALSEAALPDGPRVRLFQVLRILGLRGAEKKEEVIRKNRSPTVLSRRLYDATKVWYTKLLKRAYLHRDQPCPPSAWPHGAWSDQRAKMKSNRQVPPKVSSPMDPRMVHG